MPEHSGALSASRQADLATPLHIAARYGMLLYVRKLWSGAFPLLSRRRFRAGRASARL